MLTTYLNTIPYTKLILIEDTLEENGRKLLDYLINNHNKLSNNKYEKHLFVFEGNFKRTERKYSQQELICHDFVSETNCWKSLEEKIEIFHKMLDKINEKAVIIIDSLVHCIYQIELSETYRILNDLVKNKKNILQTITLFHKDLIISEDYHVQYFQHLATLILTLQPSTDTITKPQIDYIYKKESGKMVKSIETFYFDNNERLVTETIDKIDSKQLIKTTVDESILPENLTTFKISLNEKDKVLRDKLVLPYLPKQEQTGGGGGDSIKEKEKSVGGNIYYTFDDVDDWDEEDPDDDLDI